MALPRWGVIHLFISHPKLHVPTYLGHRRVLTTEPHPEEFKCTWRLDDFLMVLYNLPYLCALLGIQQSTVKKTTDGTTGRFRQKVFFDFVDTSANILLVFRVESLLHCSNSAK